MQKQNSTRNKASSRFELAFFYWNHSILRYASFFVYSKLCWAIYCSLKCVQLQHMQLQMDRLTSEILQKDAATQEADARALRAERSNASHADDKKKTKALNEQLMAEKKRVEELERQVHEAQDRIEQLEAAHRSITNENEFLRKVRFLDSKCLYSLYSLNDCDFRSCANASKIRKVPKQLELNN